MKSQEVKELLDFVNSKKKDINAINRYNDISIKDAANMFLLVLFLKGSTIELILKRLFLVNFVLPICIKSSKIQIQFKS